MDSAIATAVSTITSQAATFVADAAPVAVPALSVMFLLWGVPKAVRFFKRVAN